MRALEPDGSSARGGRRHTERERQNGAFLVCGATVQWYHRSTSSYGAAAQKDELKAEKNEPKAEKNELKTEKDELKVEKD